MTMRLLHARHTAGASALVVACLALAACDAGSALPGNSSDDPSESTGSTGADEEPEQPIAKVTTNVDKGATDVPVDKPIEIAVRDGKLTKVSVTSEAGELPGAISDDKAGWASTDGLEPGATYTVRAVAKGDDGKTVRETSRFTTMPLTLDQQTYPSVAPLAGEEVGVGMPVIVTFDVPVTDRAAFEKHMSVESSPAQPGSWYWLSDNEAHWRPKTYWKAGTEVSVDVDVNGVAAGKGIYGQEDREVDFSVGDANVYRVNADTYQMRVLSNGKLLRTIPVTTGKPGFITRSGVKVIMEKFDSKRMNSETVGIPQGSSEAYDIDNVQWAMRLTSSGEFIHAAPWSVGSQGSANVSHGCTGLSPENAGWLYAMSKRGDVVEYVGTDRPMEPGNGYSDWNMSFAEYKQGSALN
jgi:lipoprotein-anchoring transpeptidase ErfK/SrfK